MATKGTTKPAKPAKKPDAPAANAMDVTKAMGAAEVAKKFRLIHDIEGTLTDENMSKFVLGEASLAQLMGITIDQSYALAEYAYTLFQQGRIREARQIFEALVIQNPIDGYMHFMLGAIYWKLDMPEEAVEEYGTAISLDPNNIAAHTNRGEILLQHGEFEDALDDLRTAIELDKKGDDPFALRARALATATAEVIKALMEQKKK
ncbi:MAG: tetratricopeptide repeat protein [Deltaproteobacteria bacterium]|nr:tetratricopeptide repeat protein [Deltaproteobacteria bacterium]